MKHPIRSTFTAQARLRPMIVGCLAAIVFAAIAAPALADGPAVGAEFQVNTYTTGGQDRPAVASSQSGDFVVVWESDLQDGDWEGIFGQRLDSTGSPVGVEFQVNDYTTNDQTKPSVGMDDSGAFVVAWESYLSGGTDTLYSIQGQRFASDGSPAGDQFQVNSFTTYRQYHPAVGVHGDGSFVVVWDSYYGCGGTDGDYAIVGRRFASDGQPVGGDFQVNTFTTGDQENPQVAPAPDRGFMVVWDSPGQDGDGQGVFGQLFDSGGGAVGNELQINSYTTGGQSAASIASGSDGSIVVTWTSWNTQDGSYQGVFGQRLTSAGTPAGSEFQVNTSTFGNQGASGVAVDRTTGGFLVAWNDHWVDELVQARLYQSDGSPSTGEFLLTPSTEQGQDLQAAVAAGADGAFITVWAGRADDSGSIQARMVAPRIFADGFESGGTTAWSATVGGP